MNLRSVDLNLLVILEALLEEVHVSRAAARLGLSQPATSAALERCRALFGDPLLERSGPGMGLTTRAEALRGPLREALVGVAELLDQRGPDLASMRRTVRIMMADVLTAHCVPDVCKAIRDKAPGLDLVFCQWSGGISGLELAARGAIDIVVSAFQGIADVRRFHVEDVIEQEYVVAMCEGHPASERFDLETWLNWPHVIVSYSGDTHGVLDELLAGLDRTRRVGMSVPSFLLVPSILRTCDMIGMVPRMTLTGDMGRGLVVFPPPIPVAGFTLKLARHRRHDRDPAVRFVCEELARSLRCMPHASGA